MNELMHKRQPLSHYLLHSAAIAALGSLSACSTVKSVFAIKEETPPNGPITNPFLGYDPQSSGRAQESVVLRTKKGDRSVEVELPNRHGQMGDLVMPVSPAFKDGSRSPANIDPEADQSYKQRAPSISDREIAATLPQSSSENEGGRREVEAGLGVMPSEDGPPAADYSYLATMDQIKKLYKNARFEAALLETDQLLRAYPTDSKLYEMRGTLYERMGRMDLALRSWNQSIRLDPGNLSLKKYVERKQGRVRETASETR